MSGQCPERGSGDCLDIFALFCLPSNTSPMLSGRQVPWSSGSADSFLPHSFPSPSLSWVCSVVSPHLTRWNFAHCLEDNERGSEPARASLSTSGLRAGVRGEQGRTAGPGLGSRDFSGCSLAKGLSLESLWPFLGTQSWSVAQVLAENECVETY